MFYKSARPFISIASLSNNFLFRLRLLLPTLFIFSFSHFLPAHIRVHRHDHHHACFSFQSEYDLIFIPRSNFEFLRCIHIFFNLFFLPPRVNYTGRHSRNFFFFSFALNFSFCPAWFKKLCWIFFPGAVSSLSFQLFDSLQYFYIKILLARTRSTKTQRRRKKIFISIKRSPNGATRSIFRVLWENLIALIAPGASINFPMASHQRRHHHRPSYA